jgi:hypothetical protein
MHIIAKLPVIRRQISSRHLKGAVMAHRAGPCGYVRVTTAIRSLYATLGAGLRLRLSATLAELYPNAQKHELDQFGTT